MSRKIILVAMLVGATLVLTLSLNIPGNIANRDFIAYWTAGKLLADRHNPYDRDAVLALELSEGIKGHRVNRVRNPPWALWLMLPLGFLSASRAWLLWMAICTAALLLSIRLCWLLYGRGDPQMKSFFLLWTVAFAPVLACLMAGQAALLVLLALILFFRYESTHPFWGGAALVVLFAKVQLFAPLFVVVTIWAILGRRWIFILGFVVALCTTVSAALLLDPQIFAHYRFAIAQDRISGDFIPSLSGVMRALLFPRLMWVQFVPLLGALIWTVWYYRKVTVWDWRTNGLLVLVVCILVAPYLFLPDETVLLPVLLHSGQRINSTNQSSTRVRLLLWLLLLLTGVLLLMVVGGVPLSSGFYCWSGLVWASWFWLGENSKRSTRSISALSGMWPVSGS